jgi:hypothetical protein
MVTQQLASPNYDTYPAFRSVIALRFVRKYLRILRAWRQEFQNLRLARSLENRATSSFSQVSEEQHVIWRILVSDYRRIQIRAVLSLEAVTTLWPSALNCAERTSPSWHIGPATGTGQHVFRFSSSAVSLTRSIRQYRTV